APQALRVARADGVGRGRAPFVNAVGQAGRVGPGPAVDRITAGRSFALRHERARAAGAALPDLIVGHHVFAVGVLGGDLEGRGPRRHEGSAVIHRGRGGDGV